MQAIKDIFPELKVLHEEIIVHPSLEATNRGYQVEARVTLEVEIGGEIYVCNKVIPLPLRRVK